MKNEKDELTNLFRTRLSHAEMEVREGFWDELSQGIPHASQQRRRLLLFRVAAAASVLLVLAASSAAFLYFSPKQEIKEAFTQVQVANQATMNGDGVWMRQHSVPVQSILSKPVLSSPVLVSSDTETEDTVSYAFSMSFTFSSASASAFVHQDCSTHQQQKEYWEMAHVLTQMAEDDSDGLSGSAQVKKEKVARWAIKAQVGTSLPAEEGKYKMPVTAGVTLERKLTDCLAIESGLLYSNLRSEGQHLHYLGIPVRLNVTLWDTQKIQLYASGGGVADKCVAGAPELSFKEEPIQLAVTAGVGIHYKINDCVALFAEPGVVHYFGTDSPLATVRTKRPTNFNLLCGVRMTY